MKNRIAMGLACAVALCACGEKGRDASQGTAGSKLTVVSTAAPWVLTQNPGPNNYTVPVGTAIFALFSAPLDPATVTSDTLTLTGSGALVSGTVGYDPATNKAYFAPTAPLSPGVRYTVNLLAGITDPSGKAIAASSWSFTTASPSTAAPTPGSLNVSTGAGVASTIALPFTTSVDPTTITAETFTLTDYSTGAPVAGTVFHDVPTNSAVLVPSAALAPGATYALTATTGIASPSGVHLPTNRTFTFTTTAGADATPPAPISTTPASGATGVAVDASLSVLFSEAVDGSTVDPATFTVTDVAGAVSYDAATNRATFTPARALARGITYTATLSGVKDAAGNSMAPLSWSFTAESLYSGLLSDMWVDDDGHLLTTQNAWSNNSSERGVKLQWDVSPVGGAWQYQYTLVGAAKGVNKWVRDIYLGAPQGFDTADLLPGWTFLEPVNGLMAQTGVVPTTPARPWTALSSWSSTPLAISGIFWQAMSNSVRVDPGTMFVLTFRTTRAPAWGDVLLDSGTQAGCGQGTCAYPVAVNAGLGSPVDASVAPAAGNHGGWALVPGPVQAAGSGPMVTAVTPATDASGVAATTRITATFSASMDGSTIDASTFKVSNTPGAVSYDDASRTATFTPSAPLALSSTYTVRLSPDIADASGHPLAPWTWSFTTAGLAGQPSVLSMTPPGGAIGVALDATITAKFSDDMDPSTLTTENFGVSGIAGKVSYDAASRTATFTPGANLSPGTTYTPAVTTNVKSTAGQALGSLTTWAFTTAGVASEADGSSPAVIATSPADGATDAKVDAVITATFSEALNPDTVSAATFTVNGVAGEVAYDPAARVATFRPREALVAGAAYTATITPGVKDVGGNALAEPKTWTFQTAAAAAGTSPSEPATTSSSGTKSSGCASGGLSSPISLVALGVAGLVRRRRRPAAGASS